MKRLLFAGLMLLLLGIGFTILAQDGEDDTPILQLSVAGVTCDLVLEGADTEPEMEATEEATAEPTVEMTEEPVVEATEEAETEPELPVITVGEDCDNVISQLRVARNGTLWIALAVPDEEEWQEFSTPEDEEFAAQFDRRGRFVGCRIPTEGEQICRITWEQDDVIYVIEIPIIVGNAFVAPQPAANTSSSAEPTSSNTSSGEWGACGSCSTCGANANTCVTSPDGQCVADPGRCDAPPQPMTTEEP